MRRLWALVRGLPPDAAVWRQDAFPPVQELLAQLLEHQDAWGRATLGALMGERRVSVPPQIRIRRPGEPDGPRVEKDPAVIARFLSRTFQAGH